MLALQSYRIAMFSALPLCEIRQSIHRRMARKIKRGARPDAVSFMIDNDERVNLDHSRETDEEEVRTTRSTARKAFADR